MRSRERVVKESYCEGSLKNREMKRIERKRNDDDDAIGFGG